MRQVLTLRQTVRALGDRRHLAVLLLGFCSGFPWVLHGSVLTLWLQQSGLSRTAIGFIGAVAVVYAFNWMWAPLLDRVRLPLLHRRFGRRRSWILLCLLLLAAFAGLISLSDPAGNLALTGALALAIAAVSATLDISVDAYRITVFSKEEMDVKMPYAAAMSTAGWFAGYGFLGGALALALGGETVGLSWPAVYRILALVCALLALAALLTPAPEEAAPPEPRSPGAGALLSRWAIEPFREFFRRCGPQLALAVLLLLLVFRLGEAMLGRMSLVFYVEIGFTTDQIGFYQKFYGGLLTAAFSVAGAMINTRYGVVRGLFVAGVAMAAANLLFALLAVVGPDTGLLMAALAIDNFFQAFAAVAFVSFISYFTSRTYTGTQYALMSSISNFGRTTLAAGSGAVIDLLGGDWAMFFVLTALMVVPGLCLLLWTGRLLERYGAPSSP